MIRALVTTKIQSAIDTLIESGRLPRVGYPAVIVEDTKQPEHGDLATNWAMVSFKALSASPSLAEADVRAAQSGEGAEGGGRFPQNPRALGELLAEQLRLDDDFTKVDVAGPGFVNVTLKSSVLAEIVGDVRGRSGGSVLEDSAHFGRPSQSSPSLQSSRPQKINLEFVSVNPNGPITIGSGRGAAYGSTLANVLQVAGHDVHREYYINDGVNSEQMRLFAESVRAMGLGHEVPEGGYRGDYVQAVADQYLAGAQDYFADIVEQRLASIGQMFQMASDPAKRGDLRDFLSSELSSAHAISQRLGDEPSGRDMLPSKDPKEELQTISTPALQHIAQGLMLSAQRRDLNTFGVTFDTWFSEQSLHDSGQVEQHIDSLVGANVADEKPERTKLKMSKGWVIEEVVREPQNDKMEEEEGESPPPTPGTDIPADAEGATTLWLRSTLFGDDMDRVLRRKDGRLTYIASDVAYHADKFNRPANADKLITVLGPDHHGYINRLHAVVAAEFMAESGTPSLAGADVRAVESGEGVGGGGWTSDQERDLYHGDLAFRDKCLAARKLSDEKLTVQIFQLVRFMKDGKPAPMRKRDGNIYALIDLINEIGEKVRPNGTQEEKQAAGKDVARFFYLMRHHDTTFDFDLNLAEKQSDENPVFYVQYAHARICSVLEKAAETGISASTANGEGAIHPKERALILKIADLSYEVERCAEDYAVNRLTTYAIELARLFHGFYDSCRVIDTGDIKTSQWRVGLCEAARAALKASLEILGVEAPNRMERDVQSTD